MQELKSSALQPSDILTDCRKLEYKAQVNKVQGQGGISRHWVLEIWFLDLEKKKIV